MNNKNLEIESVSNLLKETLGIPIYQRPYRMDNGIFNITI